MRQRRKRDGADRLMLASGKFEQSWHQNHPNPRRPSMTAPASSVNTISSSTSSASNVPKNNNNTTPYTAYSMAFSQLCSDLRSHALMEMTIRNAVMDAVGDDYRPLLDLAPNLAELVYKFPTTTTTTGDTGIDDNDDMRKIDGNSPPLPNDKDGGDFVDAKWMLVVLVVLVLISQIYFWNSFYVLEELEAPLDHMWAVLQKPFYAHSCPVMSVHDESEATMDTDRQMVDTVPFVMISARSKDLVDLILASWQQPQQSPYTPFKVHVFDTHNISRTYQNMRCQKEAFKLRLFAVYQHAMKWMLQEWPRQSHFVMVEDDVKLLDPQGLRAELQWALHNDVGYYSFFAAGSQSPSSCLYNFGAHAQVFSRRIMEQVLEADTDSFCRIPIDMFVARLGPWYVTKHPLVQHVGKRLTSTRRHN